MFSPAATNVIEAVAPVLLQAGRFEEMITVGPPEATARAEVLRNALGDVKRSAN
jgi:SpoVK/Ycf46/Vps4 family AAA+-type ATPase